MVMDETVLIDPMKRMTGTRDPGHLARQLDDEIATAAVCDEIMRLPIWSEVLRSVLPVDLGGLGLAQDPDHTDTLFDVIARVGAVDLSAARLLEGHVNAVRLVLVHGSLPARREMARGVMGGALMGVWGANGAEPLTFTERAGGITLHGSKRFASGLGSVALAVLTARDASGGERMVLVPAEETVRQDTSRWTASAMRATASGVFDAEGIELPEHMVLGGPGDLMVEPHFEGGIWRYCAAHIGGAEGLIAEWARLLRRMGREADPLQRWRLGHALAVIGASRAGVRAAARSVEGSVGAPDTVIRAAVAGALLAREATSAACVEVMRLCEASLGMAAHDAAGPIDGRRRDLSLFLRQAAPDDKLDRAVGHYLENLA